MENEENKEKNNLKGKFLDEEIFKTKLGKIMKIIGEIGIILMGISIVVGVIYLGATFVNPSNVYVEWESIIYTIIKICSILGGGCFILSLLVPFIKMYKDAK